MKKQTDRKDEPMEELKQVARFFEMAGVLSGVSALVEIGEEQIPEKARDIARLSVSAAELLLVLGGLKIVKKRGEISSPLPEDQKKIQKAFLTGNNAVMVPVLVCDISETVLRLIQTLTEYEAPDSMMKALRVLSRAGLSQLSFSTGISLSQYCKVNGRTGERGPHGRPRFVTSLVTRKGAPAHGASVNGHPDRPLHHHWSQSDHGVFGGRVTPPIN